jgi:uncharacterized sulfatase
MSGSRPNVLWIYGEDLSPDLSCYGVKGVQTPNIDRLAMEGIRFTNAFVTAPVCSASRSALITGRYQTSFGAQHHRSCRETKLAPGIRLITEYFRDAGYFTCNSGGPPYDRQGKTDFNFDVVWPFDGIDWRERKPGQPFYAQINLPDTHRGLRDYTDFSVDPAKVVIPPYYPDTPLTRSDWAFYLASIQKLDRKVGQILERLEEEGLAEETIVFLLSDHGRGHVRDKQFLYDGGIRIPLIARWPGKLNAGAVGVELVSGIDLAPTSLHLCGLPVPEVLEGQSFLGEGRKVRSEIVAARDRCDGTEDRIRCVRTERWKYIRNYHPERAWMQFNSYKKTSYPLWSLLPAMAKAGQLSPEQARFTQPVKPFEELYDLERDPHELHDLSTDPQQKGVLNDMRARLEHWAARFGDRSAQPEDRAEVLAWTMQMHQEYQKTMRARGLDPDLPPEAFVKYWEQRLAR